MSKSRGNYTDPIIMVNKWGADSVRLYLLSTPVVKAETILLDEMTVCKIQQSSVVKLYNITTFLLDKIHLLKMADHKVTLLTVSELYNQFTLNRWIINKTGNLCKTLTTDLDAYRISALAAKVLTYISQLSKWYMKLIRNKITEDTIRVLLYVMHNLSKIIAPIMPFMAEIIYTRLQPHTLSKMASVHYESYPTDTDFISESNLEEKFELLENVITLIRETRHKLKLPTKRPIQMVRMGFIDKTMADYIADVLDIIKDETNVLNITNLDTDGLTTTSIKINTAKLSSYLKDIGRIQAMKKISTFILGQSTEQIQTLISVGTIVEPETSIQIETTHIIVEYRLRKNDPIMQSRSGIIIRMNPTSTPEIEHSYTRRLLRMILQRYRKDAKLKPWDKIHINYHTESDRLATFLASDSNSLLADNILSIMPTEEKNGYLYVLLVGNIYVDSKGAT